MSPFSFLARGNLADHAKQLTLGSYTPELTLEGLQTGVDNVRTDVYLSPRFNEIARQHLMRLLAKYGNVEDFLVEDAFSRPINSGPVASGRATGFIGSPKTTPPPAATQTGKFSVAKPIEPADFKKALADLHTTALNRAKNDGNISLDLLARLAIIKYLRAEMLAQFSQLLERCRAKLKSYEGPRNVIAPKGVEMRDRFARLQISKKSVLRKAGLDLFSTLREIEKETLARLRRSLLGDTDAATYDLFLNRLLFTEDGRDDFLNAEFYVMLGNYDRDPDRFQAMLEFAIAFVKSLNVLPAGTSDEDKAIDQMLNVPENAQELMAGGTPDESNARGKAQRALLNGWVEFLEREGVMDYVLASYEAVPLLAQYSPPINPQQLKNAIISKTERKRVETLLDEHGKISPDGLHSAVKKLESAKGHDRAKLAGRYFGDFLRYHRDLRRFEALLSAMDTVNVISNDKLRELSAINNTLYEFMLPEEQKQSDHTVVSHVILKADIRDSTTLTRTLYERGLNPASYFSLNFFDPVNKLLPKYDATKVFIEGDALILALFDREGEQNFAVAKTCMLAKEMVQIVRAYNEQSQKQGLPTLELGLGICFQDSAPMYLMDGTHRIMISKALNESDRLSGCSKGARKYLQNAEATPFNVYSFQTVEDKDTGGIPDEFLIRYNIGGIHINGAAFEKLQKEISLKEHMVELAMPYGHQKVKLFSGMVPVGQGIFHKIIVREGHIPHVDFQDYTLKKWTDKNYYEVVINESIYQQMEKEFQTASFA
ncbi:MAG TPA: hypothetical protein VMZ25_04265 [Terriglobales bacterium]|nr:hypothetical protein [Terriglobales bacterium]